MSSPIVVSLLLLSSVCGAREIQQSTAEASRSSFVTTPEQALSWRSLLPSLASDQKRIWLFPSGVRHTRGWLAVLAVAGGTAALMPLDRLEPRYFRSNTSFDRFNAILSGRNTSIAAAVIPASLLIVGVFRGDAYARNTALLAAEAVIDAEMVTSVMKNISHRLRPAAVPTNQLGTSTWFRDKGVTLGGAGSFPSGHTIAAFSVATVFSHRYRHHRWVPYISYGLAGLVGFSRISLLSHFSSDVLMGAALGYSISRFVVLRTRPA